MVKQIIFDKVVDIGSMKQILYSPTIETMCPLPCKESVLAPAQVCHGP